MASWDVSLGVVLGCGVFVELSVPFNWAGG